LEVDGTDVSVSLPQRPPPTIKILTDAIAARCKVGRDNIRLIWEGKVYLSESEPLASIMKSDGHFIANIAQPPQARYRS
jgi:hypothetical protein